MRANRLQGSDEFFRSALYKSAGDSSLSQAAPGEVPGGGFNKRDLSAIYVSADRLEHKGDKERKIATMTGRPAAKAKLKLLKEQIVESKNSEVNLRAFFEGASACQLFIGKDSTIIAFNEICADYIDKLYGLKLFTGIRVTDYADMPYIGEFVNNYYKALNGTPVQIKQQIQWGDATIWCHFTYVPARDSGGEIIGVFFNLIDITKKMELRQQVFAQKQALAKIAFIQSHEVRRPVASILGLMNIFKASDYEVTKEELLMMEQAVNELDDKIKEIVNHIY